MKEFCPGGYDSVQSRRKVARAFSFAVISLGIITILSPVILSALIFLGKTAEASNELDELVIDNETVVSAEEYFIEYNKYGSTVSAEERRKVIQKVSSQITSKDSRGIALRGYFETMRCGNGEIPPLADYSEVIVSSADKYGLDWKIIPAIAGVETWFGCAGNAESYHNAWGLGGGPSTRYRFDTWEEGIDEFARMLADGYGTNVHTRLYDVASYYVYGYAGRHDKWADGVTKYFNGIDWFYQELL